MYFKKREKLFFHDEQPLYYTGVALPLTHSQWPGNKVDREKEIEVNSNRSFLFLLGTQCIAYFIYIQKGIKKFYNYLSGVKYELYCNFILISLANNKLLLC